MADGLKQMGPGPFLAEYKYDGQRAQIHLAPDGAVSIFSRNGEDHSRRFPDVADYVREASAGGCRSCVVDAEVVAIDPASGQLRPFQDLSTRARGEVQAHEVTCWTLNVCRFMCFFGVETCVAQREGAP